MTTNLLPIASAADTWRELRRLGRRRPWQLLGTVLALVAASAAGLLVPALLGLLVEAVAAATGVTAGAGATLPGILAIGAALVGAAVIGSVLAWASSILLVRLAQRTLAELRERVFDVALRRPSGVIEQAGTGDLVARVSSDVAVVNVAISSVLAAATGSFLTVVLTLVGVGVIDWRFVIAILLAAPLQIGALRWFLRRSGPVYRAQRAAEAARGQVVLETVGGADTVAALGREAEHLDGIAAASTTAIGHTMRAMRLRTTFSGHLNVAELIGLSAVLVVGYWLVTTGEVSLGGATAAALYFHNLFGPIGVLLSSVDELQNAGAGLARLVGVTSLEEPPATGRNRHRPRSSADTPALSLDGVSYAYRSGHEVLHPTSLTVQPGERIAIVGGSGAGKSTLAKVIAGILAPTGGTIELSSRPLSGLSPDELRRELVMVSQEVRVFAGSVLENLTLHRGTKRDEESATAPVDATPRSVLEAIDRLDAGWVHELPEGLLTRVGADGHRLTAAQAQHLALVRLALADPPIAVLDEATAEAGSADAERLDRATTRALEGRTSIVVAHRLSQAVVADRVVVLEHGDIVELGTHEELAAAGGRYAALWAAWSVRTPSADPVH
ncbi:ABC transporter ATP-binding protein/permease [Plantibacter flavus]|uniref:ABC transporter ATP-binding protein n=1 Tax=Plantibacter flavus TaxID=150123 RepID=UPI003F17FC40